MSFRAVFEHRDELLRAALDEFCERGYDAASLNRILAVSAMSKGQLYHHFAGKEGLYLGLVEWMIDRKAQWLAGRTMAPSEDFFAILAQQIRASLDFAAALPDVERLSRAVLRERGRPIFERVVRRFAFDAESGLAGLVADFFARGRLRRDLPLEFLQRAVLLIVNHLPELLDLGQPADLEAKLDQLLIFLRPALAPAGGEEDDPKPKGRSRR